MELGSASVALMNTLAVMSSASAGSERRALRKLEHSRDVLFVDLNESFAVAASARSSSEFVCGASDSVAISITLNPATPSVN